MLLICVHYSFPDESEATGAYYELFLPYDDSPHGYLLPKTVQKMPWTSDFRVQHDFPCRVTVLDASGGEDTATAVNQAFNKLVSICIDRDLFHVLNCKHSEPFAVLGANYPVRIERFATSLFGTTACGAVMVAYVNTDDGMQLWIPRRAAHLYTSPGKLDTTVAGGVKAGVSPLKTIIEEAAEEASLPENLIRRHIRARGVITFMGVTSDDFPGEKGLVLPDLLYTYDIELPKGVTPTPHDEEVSDFYCMSTSEVQGALLSKKFKPDSAVVLVDFLVRQGIITAESEKDYVQIIRHMHRRLPFRIKPAQ